MTLTRRTPLRLLLALAALVALSGLAGCEYAAGTRYVYFAFTQTTMSTVTYGRAVTVDGVTVDLKMDIYQPVGDTAVKRPVVMWMFGGFWVSGKRQDMAPYAQDSAYRGFVGVTIDYRIRPNGLGDVNSAARDAYDDSLAAISYLKANAATYRIDPAAVIAGGWSAGGIGALNLLYQPGGAWGPATVPVAGAVAISATAMSPIPAGRPPAIVFSAVDDSVVLHSSSVNTCNQATAVGDVCDLVSYPTGDHWIVTGQQADISPRAAHFLMDDVLLGKGY